MTDHSPSVVPGRSRLTIERARELLLESFGVEGDVSELPSYMDQNFRVKVADDSYVFKISNSLEHSGRLVAQGLALEQLTAAGLPVPHLISTSDGSSTTLRKIDGTDHLLRLVTFMPGVVMASVNPIPDDLVFDLGVLLGRVDLSLKSFDDPAMHSPFEWDVLRAAETVSKHIEFVTDGPQASLLREFCDHFIRHVLPRLNSLPHQIIHGDANDYNVLITADPGSRAIAGLIDFGDLMYTARIAELAIAAAYHMMDRVDPVGVGCALVSGYNSVNPLLEEELDVFVELVRARLCTSVSKCAKAALDEPENEYIRVSERPAWDLLNKLEQLPARLATYRFRLACGFQPFPGNGQLTDWLSARTTEFASLLNCDLRSDPSLVFDFSVGTLDWKPGDMMEPEVAGRTMNRVLEDAGAAVGVGRYDEPRLVYTGEQFGEEFQEKRTIHLGLDFFQPAGSPVFAPIDGTVFSVQNLKIPFDYGPAVVLRHAPSDGPVFFTLYGHLSTSSVADLKEGQVVKAGAEIAKMGTVDENGGWVPHLHFQIIGDMLGSSGDFIGVALPSQREVWKSICPDPNLITGVPSDRFPAAPMARENILQKRRAHSGPSLSLSYDKPLHIVRGLMQYLYEPDGTAFLDAVNNVSHVGHAHPHVVRALNRQMTALNTNTRYLHQNLAQYSERLAATLPESLSVVYLVNSGSEANDLALRMARLATGSNHVITVDGSYHGNLSSLIDISPYKHSGPGGTGTPPVTRVVPMPDPYRGEHRGYSDESGAAYARYVAEVSTELHAESGFAAFICESVLGCGGQIFLPQTYLQESFKAIRSLGGLCIADEVQVGLGRLGSHFWGFESHGVIPDIVTIGKPIGNGHPLGAVVTTRAIADAFDNGMEYFNTFGGNPASCAVGLAVLDVLEQENLQQNAREVGAHLLGLLKNLSGRHTIIGDVRGQGLFIGIELVLDRETLEPAAAEASYVVNRLRHKGILTTADGSLRNVIKIKPPMVFNRGDADRLASVLDEIMEEDFICCNFV